MAASSLLYGERAPRPGLVWTGSRYLQVANRFKLLFRPWNDSARGCGEDLNVLVSSRPLSRGGRDFAVVSVILATGREHGDGIDHQKDPRGFIVCRFDSRVTPNWDRRHWFGDDLQGAIDLFNAMHDQVETEQGKLSSGAVLLDGPAFHGAFLNHEVKQERGY